MVYDPINGCVRGRDAKRSSPMDIIIFRAIENHHYSWSKALPVPIPVALESKLQEAYPTIKEGIKELARKTHPTHPGFTLYGIEKSDKQELLAYRGGCCKVIVAGSPDIHESDISGLIDFNCRMCKSPMYNEEVAPYRRTISQAPNLEED